MKRKCNLVFSLLGLIYNNVMVANANQTKSPELQAAFIRDGNLWTKLGVQEQQITFHRVVSSPKWSHDGKWIAYFVSVDPDFHRLNTLRVRNVKTNQDVMVAAFDKNDHCSFTWSPNRDILAFQKDTILNDIDMHHLREQGFRNVSLGVSQFAWLPDGTGFMVSSSAHVMPDGWTHARLYTVSLSPRQSLIGTAVPFYELPNEVSMAGTKILAIGTSSFKWSPDRQWVAFIVHPTASWSMDSDLLCVLSMRDKRLIPIAEMIDRYDWFEWSPTKDTLAFIEGAGRFITKNKRLGVAKAPDFRTDASATPPGYVDNALVWTDHSSIVVSRAKEGDYRAKLPPEQLPSLYEVRVPDTTLNGGTQLRLTKPPFGFGDYQPTWHELSHSLVWIRSNSDTSSVWIKGKHATAMMPWIQGINRENWTHYWSMWDKLIDIR